MSWTNPKTWSFGEVLTSTDMNIYVRDNTDDLDTRVGALLAGGIGSNVVQAVKTDTFTTTSTSFTNVTGMSATITPTSASSKVLIIVQLSASMSDADGSAAHFRLTGGNTSGYIGDAAASQTRATISAGRRRSFNQSSQQYAMVISFLDSPSTTSATTYTLQTRRGGAGQVLVNREGDDFSSADSGRTTSSITVIEVAA